VSAAPDIDRAAEFVWLSARLLDRHRFARLFGDGDADAVVEALRPYRNPDGGFGNALEPDLRGPVSQPGPTASAFEVLLELGRLHDPMVGGALGYLETITNPDGGVPSVLPSAGEYPRAPWWQADDDPPSSLLMTALLAAPLLGGAVQHPWLERASEYCWTAIETLDYTSAYAARFAVAFVDHVPDRERAIPALERIGPRLLDSGLVALDPDEPGEIHTPLDFTPNPALSSRVLWSDEVIDRHLDGLAAGQQADGGWTFNWRAWAPMVEREWRGVVTVRALKILGDYGRLDGSRR
jgi:hypothetical protein